MNYNKIEKSKTVGDVTPDTIFEVENVETIVGQLQELMATVSGCDRLNVRKAPDISSPVLTTVASGDELNIQEVVDKWHHVLTDTDVDGYVLSQYLGPTRVR